MSGAFGSSQWAYSSGVAGYQIEDSLRFEDGSSAYLNRTPASAGNRKTWTWSSWVKRGNLGGTQMLFTSFDGTNGTELRYVSGGASGVADSFQLSSFTGGYYQKTLPVHRDPSAWGHLTVSVDTTQATASNRVKIYFNGVQLANDGTTNIPQNYDTHINNNIKHTIGNRAENNTLYFDGYLSDVYFIDGQALDPTSFGETIDGYWRPVAYSGSYGTNGFHLDFNGNANDASGNGNNWTANNISAHDYVPDSPTNNFATLNVLTKGTSNLTLTEGNLKANAVASPSGSNWGTVFSSHTLPSTGKYYVEGLAFINAGVGNNSHLGILDTSSFQPAHSNITYAYTTGEGFDGVYVSLFNNYAQPVSDGVLGTAEGSLTDTTVLVMLAVDVDNGKVWAGYNGTWLNSGDPNAGTGEIATRTFTTNDAIAVGVAYNGSNDQGMFANFGQDSTFAGAKPMGAYTDDNSIGNFQYAPPAGYLALCTANLPTPTIIDGSEHFNTVLYTGTGATQSITGVGFGSAPDFVWVKRRSAAGDHILSDSVRTAGKYLSSNLTAAEITSTDFGSFDSDGFTVNAVDQTGGLNASGNTYASWNWKAGGTAVSNTAGSITSQVSANVDAGFSIVSWVGNATAGATIGHGLGVQPSMIITKNRNNGSEYWSVYHKDVGNTAALFLNSTGAAYTSSAYWNNTSPTTSVFSIGSNPVINESGSGIIAYCFANTEGYLKAGKYTGNGQSGDGAPFVYTGGKIQWLMIKRTDSTSNWTILDNTRGAYNVNGQFLAANLSNSETYESTRQADFLSNGFKPRPTSIANNDINSSGGSYIFLAIASTPFKHATAR